MVGTGDRVAVPGQCVPERRGIPDLARHGHRLLTERPTPGLVVHERQRHRQPGQHPGPQARRRRIEGVEGFLKQLDLYRVEQLHLEATQTAPSPSAARASCSASPLFRAMTAACW